MSKPLSRWPRRDRGAAAVEFALVLPLLLLVIGGVVDFGRALYTQVTLTNAAREGARAAVVGGDAAGRANAASQGVLTLPPTIDGECPPSGDDLMVEVTVSADFDWIILGPAMNLFGGSDALPSPLSSSATMACGG